MKTEIKTLDKEYRELVIKTHELSKIIIDHLHEVFDSKLDSYKSFDDFLEEINYYAGDTFGKLMYINFAKNYYDKN